MTKPLDIAVLVISYFTSKIMLSNMIKSIDSVHWHWSI